MGKLLQLQPTDPLAIRRIFRDESNRLYERLERGMPYIDSLPAGPERAAAERLWVKLLRAYEHLEDRIKELTDEIEGPIPGAIGRAEKIHPGEKP